MEAEVIRLVDALAAQARSGDKDAAARLWQSVRRWAASIAKEYAPAAAANGGADMEDLMQSAAVGVLRAAAAYEPHRGAFLAWAAYYIRQELRALLGLSGRQRLEHYNTTSMDAPIDPAGEMTLHDIIPCGVDTAVEACARADDGAIIEKAREVLQGHPAEWATIDAVDLQGLHIKDAAAAQGIAPEEAARTRKAGLRRLRHAPCFRLFNPFYSNRRGLNTFRTTHTSATEAAALWNIENEGGHAQHV